MKWLILLALLLALAFALGSRFGRQSARGSVAFTPVADLAADVRSRIEKDLASGLDQRAARTYRSATGASQQAATAALATHRRKASE